MTTPPHEPAQLQAPAPPQDLPTVTPPTAGFLVQLFGVPLAIVAVAVLVWLLFGKIAASHRTPEEYLDDLHSSNFERRWSAARDLASILPRNKEWQENEAFAQKIANELETQLAAGPTGPNEIHYVHYIAETLGEFQSLVGVPALRKALDAGADRDIREAAVMGLGKLADRVGGLRDSGAIADLLTTTRDDDPAIRVKATWILGRTANPEAIPGLIPLLGASDVEVRHNAAASLARLGSDAGVAVLAEMMDLEQLRPSLEARGLTPSQIESQMVAIPWSAMQSLMLLLDTAPQTDLEQLRKPAETLSRTGKTRVAVCANEFLLRLNKSKPNK
jgi:HEAT repeat protein